jgi:hypothetical protein
VVAHRKGKKKEANEAVDAIKQKYSLQGGGRASVVPWSVSNTRPLQQDALACSV